MNRRCPPAFILLRHGFTMLELVVVVLILGMIAAIASSQIFDTANDARKNSSRQSLDVIRNAIDLYYQKNGEYPGQKGKDKEFKAEVRTMIRTPFPTCPIGNKNDKVHIEDKPGRLKAGGPKGWRYSKITGEFIINHRNYSSW
jgi:general secretion pathway protein G